MTETTSVSYRHEVNPALATNLLNELQTAIAEQQKQLRKVVKQIQALYAEGPVVKGWLESSADEPNAPQAASAASSDPSVDPSILFRHGEVEDLLAYVQAIDGQPDHQAAIPFAATPSPAGAALVPDQALVDGPSYRLCQLDANGQLRSQRCPPAQVPIVSMAIVRHQKLTKLVTQKQTVEAKLKQVVDTLTELKTLLTEG